MTGPRENMVGMRFGKWTVQAFVGRRGNGSIWRCRCDCGATKVIRRWELLHSIKRACNRCALLESPAYRRVAAWRAADMPQVEMARRLGVLDERTTRAVERSHGKANRGAGMIVAR
jgi:hypothetical protein